MHHGLGSITQEWARGDHAAAGAPQMTGQHTSKLPTKPSVQALITLNIRSNKPARTRKLPRREGWAGRSTRCWRGRRVVVALHLVAAAACTSMGLRPLHALSSARGACLGLLPEASAGEERTECSMLAVCGVLAQVAVGCLV